MLYYFKIDFFLIKASVPIIISLCTSETDNPQEFSLKSVGESHTAHQTSLIRKVEFLLNGNEYSINVPDEKQKIQEVVAAKNGVFVRVQCEIFFEAPLNPTIGGESNDKFWSAFTTKSNCRCGLNDIIWIEDYEKVVKDGSDKTKSVMLVGTFMEGGLIPTAISDATIELKICVDEVWKVFGKAKTNKKGVVRFDVPFYDIFAGRTQLLPNKLPMKMTRCVEKAGQSFMKGGSSSIKCKEEDDEDDEKEEEREKLLDVDVQYVAEGFLWVLHKGTHVVVYDLDGTLTTGNRGIIMQIALGLFGVTTEPQQINGSSALCNYWVGKGCLPVYASGRSGIYCNITRQWLRRHGFPPGLLFLTDGVLPAMPFRASPIGLQSAESFKYRSLLGLVVKGGVEIAGGYGDIESDRSVYSNLGVPRIYIKPLIDGGYYPHIYDLEKNILQHSQPAPIAIPMKNLSWTIDVTNEV